MTTPAERPSPEIREEATPSWFKGKDGSKPNMFSRKQRHILEALVNGEMHHERSYAMRSLVFRGMVIASESEPGRYAITEAGYRIIHPPIPGSEEIGDLVVPDGAVPMRIYGGFTLVDPEDYHTFARHHWSLRRDGYVMRATYKVDKPKGQSRSPIYLAREILACPDGMTVDHINRNPLDNRRCNLRLATRMQQQWNQAPKGTGLIGVSHRTKAGFFSKYKDRGRVIRLGPFPTAEDAARAYDGAILAQRGEFAVLNFPRYDGVLTPGDSDAK